MKIIISIHTPAWGVTYIICPKCILEHDFNPHARVGRDPEIAIEAHCLHYFNPHARVGRDV